MCEGEATLGGVCGKEEAHLVDVDAGLPVVVAQQVEVAHADLAEVARVVLVEVGAVVVLAARHAAPTRVLAVLADAAVAGGDVAAAVCWFRALALFLCLCCLVERGGRGGAEEVWAELCCVLRGLRGR